MQYPGSKCNRRNVPLPGGTQAEDEPQSACRETRLIRMRNDRRIEQRRGFQRIFGQKIGTNQMPPLDGEILIALERLADLFKTFQENTIKILNGLGELG